MNAVPVFEAKNKLPFYIHQAEEGSPVAISRHNNIVAERRVAYGLEDDDFDISAYYESIKERGYYGKSDSENLFEGV